MGHACAVVAALSVGNLTNWESVADDPAGPPQDELAFARSQAQQKAREAQKKQAPRWSQFRDDLEGFCG